MEVKIDGVKYTPNDAVICIKMTDHFKQTFSPLNLEMDSVPEKNTVHSPEVMVKIARYNDLSNGVWYDKENFLLSLMLHSGDVQNIQQMPDDNYYYACFVKEKIESYDPEYIKQWMKI